MLVKYRLSNPYSGSDMHKHHVVPRCLKPTKNIVVKLSLQEHTIAHWWLIKICNKRNKFKKNKNELRCAFIGLRNKWFKSRYKCTLEKEWLQYERDFCKKLKSFTI